MLDFSLIRNFYRICALLNILTPYYNFRMWFYWKCGGTVGPHHKFDGMQNRAVAWTNWAVQKKRYWRTGKYYD